MQRVPELDETTLSEDQRRVYDAIVAGPRGRVEGPLKVWLLSPALAERAQGLGAFCRYGTSLPPRLSELAIIITGAFWRAAFEWHVHARLAIKAGIDRRAVEDIRCGRAPNLPNDDEAAVYAFARELLDTRQVQDATYRRTVDALGLEAVVELVGVLGYYGLISMTIKTFGVPLPSGAPEPFADI